MRRRELDGCPVTGALQMIGDRWTMLVVRDLAAGPKRTSELLDGLPGLLPGSMIRQLIYAAVLKPAFAVNETVVYRHAS